MYNQMYPDNDKSRYSKATLTEKDFDDLAELETRALAEFKVQSPSYICYRVVAMDGLRPNHTGLRARAQWVYPTLASVRKHLLWVHFESPWISLSSSWALALRRATYFTHKCDASSVYIMVIDMEPIEAACIDAYQFALAHSFSAPLLYRGEVLRFNAIPESCFLGEIPAQLPVPESPTRLRLNVPEDLLIEAISTYTKRLSPSRESANDDLIRDCEAVRCWLFDSIWSRSITAPQAKMIRIMQSFAEN